MDILYIAKETHWRYSWAGVIFDFKLKYFEQFLNKVICRY